MSKEFEEFERTGIFQKGITVSQLIKHLESYKVLYGDNPVSISISGDENTITQFDYFENTLMIDVEEDETE